MTGNALSFFDRLVYVNTDESEVNAAGRLREVQQIGSFTASRALSVVARARDWRRVLFAGHQDPRAHISQVESGDDYAVRHADDIFRACLRSLTEGEPVLVQKETTELVIHAAEQLLADTGLQPVAGDSEVPLQRAALFFETPMFLPSRSERLQDMWVIRFALFMDGALYSEELRNHHVYIFAVEPIRDVKPGNAVPEHPMSSFFLVLPMDEKPIETATPRLVAFLWAFWALMRQPIISEERIRPNDPESRRARKVSHADGYITVARLRQRLRPAGAEASGSGREFSHRFIVRGFWRNQAYGLRMTLRRRIWIDSYVKGPADKPLVIGNRIIKE